MTDVAPPRMSSNRPYLLRAMYDWITDNGYTPHLLVDAQRPGLQVPAFAVKDGKVVLNIAMRAVDQLDLGNERIRFQARFSGVSHALSIPLDAVEAIYAQENGQGMLLPPDEPGALTAAEPEEAGQTPPVDDDPPPRRSHLRIVK